ncbi:hypothetical protein MBLNU230_g6218t1 [Neophaeotheca triangularis]
MEDQPQQPARRSTRDVEKGAPNLAPTVRTSNDVNNNSASTDGAFKRNLQAFERVLIRYNLEARGIQRVLPEERHDLSQLGYSQIGVLWFSFNLVANNVTLGMLGPAVFYLSFLDSSLCAIFGMLVGSLVPAYIATFGPRSGNRSMVFARYTMGWWPAKLVVILNIIVLLGYALIDAVVAGQIISAVSVSGDLSVIVGIVIVAVITWVITTFGYSIFHLYERYAWLPQLIVLAILAGVAGPNFDLDAKPSEGETARTIAGNRLSFFSLCLAAAITWAGGAADYFVYYPEHTPRWKVFTVTMIGLSLGFSFAFMVGIGLGSGILNNQAWSNAYNVSPGSLIVEGFNPIGTFGSFCSVVIALGLIANMIPPTYSTSVDFQVLGRYPEKIPRVIWNTIGVIIYTVCAIAGRSNLADIFTNFLALMGYWVSSWAVISLEEHLIFRRWKKLGWNWDAWDDRSKLPVGIAALVAFLVGWIGSILCMAQVWYIGPLAGLVGDYGADMGNYVGFAWAGLVFPPLRWLELRKFGR